MWERLRALVGERRTAAVAAAALVLLVVVVGLSSALGGGDDGEVTAPRSPSTTEAQADAPPTSEPEEDGPLASARAIQAAVERAEPGEDLVIVSGTYELSLDIDGVSGTADEPIRLRAEPGGEVEIVAKGEPYALYVHNAAHWVIGSDDARLTFDGDGEAHATVGLGLYSGSVAETSNDDPGPAEHITLQNLDVVDAGQALLRIAHGSTAIDVVDSRLAGSGRRRAEFGEGIYIGSAAGEDLVDDVQIRDVRISDVRAEAIDVKGGSDGIFVRGVEITDVVLRSDDTNNKCAIAQRSDGLLSVADTVISGVTSGEDVEVSRNEPCGIYVDGPVSIERTTITDTEREAVWVNNSDPGIDVRIVDMEFSANGGEPSGVTHSGEPVEWTVRLVDTEHLAPAVAGPNVERAPEEASAVTTTAADGA